MLIDESDVVRTGLEVPLDTLLQSKVSRIPPAMVADENQLGGIVEFGCILIAQTIIHGFQEIPAWIVRPHVDLILFLAGTLPYMYD